MPAPNQVFDYPSKQWVDSRTLSEIKEAKWESIKAKRAEAIDAPLVTPYGTFDSRVKDRTNITDAVLMAQTLESRGLPSSIDFTLTDNTTVVLSAESMINVGLLLGQKIQAAHARARELRAQIDAATTKQEIEAITW